MEPLFSNIYLFSLKKSQDVKNKKNKNKNKEILRREK